MMGKEEISHDEEKTIAASGIDAQDTTIAFNGVNTTTAQDTTPALNVNETVASTEHSESSIVDVIENGALLLDTYQVRSDAIEGGMGKVWRVFHTGWHIDLALKQPKANLFQDQQQKDIFIHECEAWMNLGLHPHIVSCYYVREIQGTPSIFSEWMEGGSLKDWIQNGRLYEGGEQATLKRILDIAIQYAQGLKYAHDQGLIHQDVKPDNLLLTMQADAKVADFGIAHARGILNIQDVGIPADGTMMSNSGAYTPAYCSPEQFGGQTLTRRSDIYSWAVCVLEMFLGGRLWQSGVIAGTACEDYFAMDMKVTVPEALKDVLRSCFDTNPEKRPHDFETIVSALLQIYQDATTNDYPRKKSDAAVESADSLNNKALSYLDLGKIDKALHYWEEGLEKEPGHAACIYNHSLVLWKKGELSDREALDLVSTNAKEHAYYYLAKLHLACGNAEEALSLLEQQNSNFRDTEQTITTARHMLETHRAIECVRKTSLESDKCGIDAFEFDTIGQRAISQGTIGDDKSIDLWDMNTGALIASYPNDDLNFNSVNNFVFHPEGKTVVVGSHCYIEVLELEHMTCVCNFEDSFANNRICLSSDGNLILSGNRPAARLWDIREARLIKKFVRDGDGCTAVAFSPDGATCLTANRSREITLWDIETGCQIKTLQGHTSFAQNACFSPDGSKILSADFNGAVKLWDVTSEQCLFTRQGNSEILQFSPNGEMILLGDKSYIEVWNLNPLSCIRTIETSFKAAAFAFDDNSLFSVSEDYLISQWSIHKNYPAEMILSEISATKAALTHDETFRIKRAEVESLIKDRNIKAALEQLDELAQIPFHGQSDAYHMLKDDVSRYCITDNIRLANIVTLGGERVEQLCISPNNKKMLVLDDMDMLSLLDIDTNQQIWSTEGLTERALSLCFSPDNTLVAESGNDKIGLWDASTGENLYILTAHHDYVEAICFTPDSTKMLSGSDDATINIWDVETGKLLNTLEGHEKAVLSLDISPDGNSAVSASSDTTIRLWNLSDGTCLSMFIGHQDKVSSVRFSPDGTKILSGSNDESLKLWDLSGQCIRTFTGHNDWIDSVFFSPDGNKALSGSSIEQSVKLWDIWSGEILLDLDTHLFYPFYFSPDGSRIIATNSAQQLIVCNLDYDIRFPGWKSWDERVRPYLDIFISQHPSYTEEDFDCFILELQNRGLGWIEPEGIRTMMSTLIQNR